MASNNKLHKLQLDRKHKEAMAKFQLIEQYLKRQLILVEHEPVHIDELPDDFAYNLFREINSSS